MRPIDQQLYTAINTSLTTGATLQEALDGLQPKIIVGDVVRLKSGGPWMTVQFAFAHITECKWFDGLRCCEGQFHPESLEKKGCTK